MRYRALDANGDFVFTGEGQEFLVNSPACVGQAVMTRLLLAQGEWFLDALEGTPYATKILGKGTLALYDSAIQSRILGTPGVTGIAAYVSQLSAQRVLTVSATIDTQFGQTSITQTL